MGRHYSNLKIKQAIKRNEFAEALEKIDAYVRGHLELVIVAGALLVLVGALVPYWVHSRAGREAKAGNLLAEAQHVFSTPAADEGGSSYGGGYATAQEKYSQASSRFREITNVLVVVVHDTPVRQREVGQEMMRADHTSDRKISHRSVDVRSEMQPARADP